jgi:peroxiredoxin
MIGAVACLIAATALVYSAGLPQRAAFTGRIIPGEVPIAPELNARPPDFTAPTLAGDSLSLSDLRGQTVLINFWATWCEPCRIEMPVLETLYQTYQATGLRVVAINLGESPAAAQRWADEFELSFDLVLDPDNRIAPLYHLRGQPSTYVVSPDGLITQIFYGPAAEADLLAAFQPFLSS